METMNIPGIGSVQRKYVWMSLAGIGGFAAYMYWRSKTTGEPVEEEAAGNDAAATLPDYSADYAGYMGGAGAYDFSGSAPIYQSPPSVFVPVPSDHAITTNGAWDAAALDAADTLGLNSAALSTALGTYLAGRCLTAAQADMVRAVEGMFGKPPQSPSLTITVCNTSPTTPTTPSTPSAPTGFRVSGSDKRGVTVTWNKVPNAQMYLIKIIGGPQKYNHEVTDSNPPYRFGALSRKSTYHFQVRAVVGGVPGKSSGTISGRTK